MPRQAIAILLLGAFLGGCGKRSDDAAEESAPAPVTVETAARGAIDRLILADAVLYPVDQSNVTSKISAPVKRTLVNRGDHVRAGQLLAELESADLAAAAEEARHQYEQAQAAYAMLTGATVLEDRTKAQADLDSARQALDTAKKVYESREALVRQGALAQRLADEAKVSMVQAQSQFDTAQRHLDALSQVSQRETIRSAEAQMNAAKARLDNAAAQLSYARILSPIAGVVADRPVYPGEMAASGAPIASIVDVSQVVARANVPVQDTSTIQIGRPARISGPTGDVAGRVAVVSPAVDPSTTTVEVWVQAANPGERLKPGQSVRVTIVAETIQNAVIVPAPAILNGDSGSSKVLVVAGDSIAHTRQISAGVRQGDRVQILSGVQEGDRVVTSGGLGLEDGAKVRILAAAGKEDDDAPEEK
jgi:HlyD family secretion protein